MQVRPGDGEVTTALGAGQPDLRAAVGFDLADPVHGSRFPARDAPAADEETPAGAHLGALPDLQRPPVGHQIVARLEAPDVLGYVGERRHLPWKVPVGAGHLAGP